VDGVGNVYIADTSNNAIKEWSPASNTVITLPISGLSSPAGVAVDGAGNVYIADFDNAAIKEWSPASQTVTTLVSSGLNEPLAVAVDGLGNVYIVDFGLNAVFEWVAASQGLITLDTSSLSEPYDVAVDGAGNVYINDDIDGSIYKWSVESQSLSPLIPSGSLSPVSVGVDGAGNVFAFDSYSEAVDEWVAASNTVVIVPFSAVPANFAKVDTDGNIYAVTSSSQMAEKQRAFVDPTAKPESSAGGSDVLPVVLPATTDLQWAFTPTTNQTWLTINGVTNGVVSFGFAANTGAARTAIIRLLGRNISIQQFAGVGVSTRLTGTHVLGDGSLQFSFTNRPGAPFTIMTSTNASLPLSNWTSLGSPVEGPAGQYQFTDAAPTNATRFYIFVSP
jgi:streptogramin lyase